MRPFFKSHYIFFGAQYFLSDQNTQFVIEFANDHLIFDQQFVSGLWVTVGFLVVWLDMWPRNGTEFRDFLATCQDVSSSPMPP